ncbi:MAG: hypothetical protein IIW14_09515 [Kiritimatiellae bacterium]|nr:hypothetical protein [Kiritimatiellia bacterium]
MKKIFGIALVFFSASVWALDNTINNDFWNTTQYENPVTASAASGVLSSEVSTPAPMAQKSYFSGVAEIFSTIKSCFSLIFR